MAMTYGYFSEAAEIARRIPEADEWPAYDCRRLCQMAGLEAEWDKADGESFMAVLDHAAEVLGVNIYC